MRPAVFLKKISNSNVEAQYISCCLNPYFCAKREKERKQSIFVCVELKPTYAHWLVPAPLPITLTTAYGDIQATGKRESWLAAHFKQGRKGVSGREEAGRRVLARGQRPGTKPP